MSWSLVAPSKAQKEQDGSWSLADKGATTEATMSLTIDSALPLPGFMQKKVLKDTLKGATQALKKRAELIRRHLARPGLSPELVANRSGNPKGRLPGVRARRRPFGGGSARAAPEAAPARRNCAAPECAEVRRTAEAMRTSADVEHIRP